MGFYPQKSQVSRFRIFPGKMVGAVRFELTTSCTRNKRASQATLRPDSEGGQNALVLSDCKCFFRQRASGNPSGCPRGLKIESAGDAIDVEHFASEIEARTNSTLHRFEIHFA